MNNLNDFLNKLDLGIDSPAEENKTDAVDKRYWDDNVEFITAVENSFFVVDVNYSKKINFKNDIFENYKIRYKRGSPASTCSVSIIKYFTELFYVIELNFYSGINFKYYLTENEKNNDLFKYYSYSFELNLKFKEMKGGEK